MKQVFRTFILLLLFQLFKVVFIFGKQPTIPNPKENTILFDEYLEKFERAVNSSQFSIAQQWLDSLNTIIGRQSDDQLLDAVKLVDKEFAEIMYAYTLATPRRVIRERFERLRSKAEINNYNDTIKSRIYTTIGYFEYAWYNNYEEAIHLYNKADALYPGSGLAPMFISSHRANIYTAIGDLDKAKEYYEADLAYRKGKIRSGTISSIKDEDAFFSTGKKYMELLVDTEAFDQVFSFLKDSIIVRVKNRDTTHHISWLEISAFAYLKKGDTQRAIQCLSKGLTLLQEKHRQAPSHPDYTDFYNYFGAAYLQLQDYDLALQYYQRALGNLEPAFQKEANYLNFKNNPELTQVELPIALYETLRQKCELLYILRKQEAYRSAFKSTHRLVLDLLDLTMNDFIGSNKDKQLLLSKAYQLYNTGINFAYEENDPRAALAISERSKALNFYNALRDAQVERSNQVSIEEAIQLKEWRAALMALERSLIGAERAQYQKIKSEAYELRSQYDDLLQVIKARNPLLTSATAISPAMIRNQVLGNDQALIEYFVGDDFIFAFLIRPDSDKIIFERIDRKKVRVAIDALQNYWGSRDGNLSAYLGNAYFLYQQLVQPFCKYLEQTKRLIIIPDRELCLLLFSALLKHQVVAKEDQRYNDYPYLLNDFSVSYSFSMATAWEIDQRTTNGNYTADLLGIAPDFSPSSSLNLLPLNNRTEIESLREHVGTFAALTGDLNTERVLSAMNKQYRMIHFATHARADLKNPEASFIALSNASIDQQLTLNQLYSFRCNATMVVLSACQSGIGKLEKGEGAVSLSRGFLYGGVQSVVSTLWTIDDDPSIMQLFYQKLDEGLPKDVALQKAQLAFIRNNEDKGPHFWAAYNVYGKTNAIRDNSILWVVFFLITGVFVYWYLNQRAS